MHRLREKEGVTGQLLLTNYQKLIMTRSLPSYCQGLKQGNGQMFPGSPACSPHLIWYQHTTFLLGSQPCPLLGDVFGEGGFNPFFKRWRECDHIRALCSPNKKDVPGMDTISSKNRSGDFAPTVEHRDLNLSDHEASVAIIILLSQEIAIQMEPRQGRDTVLERQTMPWI